MEDLYGRKIDYMRLSVTDLCNLRCIYCMPKSGVEKLPHGNILSVEEIEEVCRSAADLGIRKIRITGGEPLVRRGIDGIARRVCRTPGVEEVCLTTNGSLLAREYAGSGRTYARMLAEAGVARVNISLDSLDPKTYARITRGGDLSEALAGMDAAIDEGLTPLKINAVLMGGVNDGDIPALIGLTEREGVHVRFIEIMPIGECAAWNRERFVSGAAVLAAARGFEPCGTEGVAEIYRKDGASGTLGIIRPISSHFCPACNRIRVTADGRLKPCLHSADEIPLKGLHGSALTDALRRGIEGKPAGHALAGGAQSGSMRGMSRIGG
jgi:cyclic pyranopterin phosphate synthase